MSDFQVFAVRPFFAVCGVLAPFVIVGGALCLVRLIGDAFQTINNRLWEENKSLEAKIEGLEFKVRNPGFRS